MKRNAIYIYLAMSVVPCIMLSMSVNGGDYISNQVSIPYIKEAPALDGNITAKEYNNALTQYWKDNGSEGLSDGKIYLYTQHDGKNLYIALDVTNDITKNDSFLMGFRDTLIIFIDTNKNYSRDETQDILIYAEPYITNSINGGIVTYGFNSTNKSNTKHVIWEISIPLSKLPKDHSFGVFIWGFGNYLAGSEKVSGYAYPERAINDTDKPDDSSENIDWHKFSQWTLMAIPPSLPTPPTLYAQYIALLSVSTIIVISGLIVFKDPEFTGDMFDVGIVLITISTIVLIVSVVQGWMPTI